VVPENSVEIEIIRLVGVGFAPFLASLGEFAPTPCQARNSSKPTESDGEGVDPLITVAKSPSHQKPLAN
jgi:hypothetical protein